MNAARAHHGLTLVETLATCAIAALAMALGASLLSGAGDPLPRAEETYLEAHALARLIATGDGPATLKLEGGQLIVRDGHGNPIIQRDWPDTVRAAALESGVEFDRFGHAGQQQIILRYGSRSVELAP